MITWSASICILYDMVQSKVQGATVDRVSVPSPIAVDILMDAMARDRAHMYLFSV